MEYDRYSSLTHEPSVDGFQGDAEYIRNPGSLAANAQKSYSIHFHQPYAPISSFFNNYSHFTLPNSSMSNEQSFNHKATNIYNLSNFQVILNWGGIKN